MKLLTPKVEIRPVEKSDYEQWKPLFEGYREFYKLEPSATVVETVWEWLDDEAVNLHGFVAVAGETLVGIAHYRPFLRPSTGSVGLWLDDLFVSPTVRGTGVGRSLIHRIESEARSQGHSVVRWITADDNATARKLYDSLAELTHWRVYDVGTH